MFPEAHFQVRSLKMELAAQFKKLKNGAGSSIFQLPAQFWSFQNELLGHQKLKNKLAAAKQDFSEA